MRPSHFQAAAALVLSLCGVAAAQIKTLNFQVVDAQYSRGLDRVVMVTVSPNQLVLLDPMSQQITGTVSLPLPPSNVSVSPDGMRAAVGHNAWISYIDLTKPTLAKSISIGCDVLEALIGKGDYIYALPRRDQWTRIYVAQISTGAEMTPPTGSYYSFYAGARGRVNNDGTALYAAQNGLSPDHVQKFDLTAGQPKYLYDWQYHGTYSAGGDLWFSEDGQRMFARSGSVFRLSSVQTADMTYNGQLAGPVTSVAHSVALNRIYALPNTSGYFYNPNPSGQGEIDMYDYQFLSQAGKLFLPHVFNNGKSYSYFGQYVFTTNDGKNVVTLMQADHNAGFLNDWAVMTLSGSGALVNSANFWIGDVAAEQIVTIFGANLANGSEQADSTPLPTEMQGVTVRITDSTGRDVPAPLFFASPSQINFKIPAGLATGKGSFTVVTNNYTSASGTVNIANVSPGLYTMTGTGQGAVAGYAVQGSAAGPIITNAFTFDSTQRQYTTNAIPYTNVRDPIVLVVYGTGLRGASNVKATIDGVPVPVAYSGAQGTFEGLDQVNIGPLPSTTLHWNLDIPVVITADGVGSNSVSIKLK